MRSKMDKTPFVSSAGLFTSWSISFLNEVVGLAIGVMTFVYISLKVLELVKKERTRDK